MRPRDDPRQRGRRRAGIRERPRFGRGGRRSPRGGGRRSGASPVLVPAVALAAFATGVTLAAAWGARGFLRGWIPEAAALVFVAGCPLSAVAVAHVAARVAASRGGGAR